MDTTKPEQHQSNQLGSINERAQRSFAILKARMKLNLFREAVLSESYPQREVDSKRVQDLLDHPEQNDKFKVENEVVQAKIEHNRTYVDDVFSKIDTLGLPDKLAVVVGLIVSGAKNNSTFDLTTAKTLIEDYITEVNSGR